MDEKRRRNLIIAIIIVAIIAIIANAVAQQQKRPSFMQAAPRDMYSPQGVLPRPIDNAGISGSYGSPLISESTDILDDLTLYHVR